MVACSVACATVPKDAPDELHAAQSSIENAKAAQADGVAPKTMRAATKALANAVDAYKDAR